MAVEPVYRRRSWCNLYRPVLTLTHRQRPNAVMPTEVGIHDFEALHRRMAWMPTCVGMTGLSAFVHQGFGPLVFHPSRHDGDPGQILEPALRLHEALELG